jgi:hypothetical protein
MALMITDTRGGYSRRMRRPAERGARMQARALFVWDQEGLWRS